MNRRIFSILLSAYLLKIKCLIYEIMRNIQNSTAHLLYWLANEYEELFIFLSVL